MTGMTGMTGATVVDRSDDMPSFEEVIAALSEHVDNTGEEPLMLGGWEVEDSTIAPPSELLRRLGRRSVHVRRYAYARELRHVRDDVADLLGRSLSVAETPLTGEHVSIQQNSTQALLVSLAALKVRGARRVVIAAPAYYAVQTICASLSLEVVTVPGADFLTGALDIPRLSREARLPGSVVLVTNPAYSLGVEYRPDDLATLERALPPDAWLLLDETRLGLSWRYREPWYRRAISPRTIVVRSPSKIFFIHGLKVSILFGEPMFLREAERLGEMLVGSLAGDTESVARAYLDTWRTWRDEAVTGSDGPLSEWRRGVVDSLQRNLAIAQSTLSPLGFRFSPVDSGPHVLAAISRERVPRLKVLAAARQHGVLLMESHYFLHSNPGWRGFRINLCGARRHQVEALTRLQALWR